MTYQLWVNEERTVLVRLWESGKVEIATRPDASAIWSAPASLLAQMLFGITQASGLAGRADSETPDVALDAIDTVDEHCVETVVTLATGDRYRVTVEWLREESP